MKFLQYLLARPKKMEDFRSTPCRQHGAARCTLLVEGFQHLVPALDCCDDLVGVLGPFEWLWLLVMLGEEAVDGSLEVDDGVEHTAFQAALRQFGEEALHRAEPGTRGWREVEGEALMALEPGAHFGVLVGSIVVEDDMHGLVDGNLSVDGIQKAADS